MILESIENGPLLWPTVEENRVTRPKKYSELSATKAIQADCDVKVTNIILQRLPPEVYALYASQAKLSTPLSITYPSNDFQSSVNHNVYNPSSSIPQVEYASLVHQQSNFSQPDTGLVVLVFQKGDDPIDAVNHMMSFFTAVVTSRYPLTNNQLINSSNPRQQATINNERVIIQLIQGRQNSITAGMSRQYTSGPCGTNSEKQRVIVCYNCKGEGHMSKQCTKPKRKKDEAWFKDKAISTPEQSNIMNQSKTEITSDSNIISYSPYLNESQYATVQNSSSPVQQDDLILSVIEQLKSQVVNCTKINQDNKNVNEILTAELERYKEQVQILKEQNNVDKASVSCAQSLEIDNLKHTLFEYLKEKGYLEQMTELLAEQAFWSQNSGNSEEPNLSTSTTIVEVPKELPKVSMVNSSLKKLKFHLASFDMIIKERTIVTAITGDTWGFEHTKACFRDEIIPFVKVLKKLFNSFDQFLINELTEIQNVFNQMEQAVEQHCVEKKNSK
nr:hypothetical protein [Tanacetum cinerariifolium]